MDPFNHKSPYIHYTLLLVGAGFVTALLISIFFQIEVVVSGAGRVVPVEKVQLVQSENLTRIKSIHVTNNQYVKKGELLIELDSTEEQSNFKTLQMQERTLIAEKLRHEVFLTVLMDKMTSTEAFQQFASLFQDYDDIERRQRSLLHSQMSDFKDEMRFLKARMETAMASKNISVTARNETSKQYALIRERLEMIESLFEKGVYSKSAFLDIQAEIQSIQKTMAVLSLEIQQGGAYVQEYIAELSYKKTNKKEELISKINDLSLRLQEIENSKIALLNAINTNILTAPMSGHVANLKNNTIGGIVDAGETLLMIVPNQGVYIEAFFNNENIGFLEVGQKANIKLAAFPAARFGYLEGTVNKISPDSIQQEGGAWGYKVNIKLAKSYLQIAGKGYPVKPGMTAQIDVVTSHRSIIEYFMAPVWDVLSNGLKEQ